MKRVLEPTEEISDETADIYTEFAKWRIPTYTVTAQDIYEKLRYPLPKTILEVSCAGGLLVNELHKLFPRAKIVGIDVSKRMVFLATNASKGTTDITFEEASVYSLPYGPNSFDLVICQGSLHHYYHPETALREMLRVTKPGGHVYIQDLRRDAPPSKIKEKLSLMGDAYQKERELVSTRASLTRKEIMDLMKKLNATEFEFKPAVFSCENLTLHKKIMELARFNEIKHMEYTDFILCIRKEKRNELETGEYPKAYQNYLEKEKGLVIDFLKDSQNVLDVGCGTGRAIPLIMTQVQKYVGVDINKDYLRAARKFSREYDNVRIIEQDAETLSRRFKPRHFDKTICLWQTIGCLKHPKKAIREIAKVTKNGLFFTVIAKGTLRQRKAYYDGLGIKHRINKSTEVIKSDVWGESRAYNKESISGLVSETGFKISKLVPIGRLGFAVYLEKQR